MYSISENELQLKALRKLLLIILLKNSIDIVILNSTKCQTE